VPAPVRVWDASDQDELTEGGDIDSYAEDIELSGHLDGVGGLATGTIDGKPLIVSGSWDCGVLVWEIRS
jgi:WD40 repeat protein